MYTNSVLLALTSFKLEFVFLFFYPFSCIGGRGIPFSVFVKTKPFLFLLFGEWGGGYHVFHFGFLFLFFFKTKGISRTLPKWATYAVKQSCWSTYMCVQVSLSLVKKECLSQLSSPGIFVISSHTDCLGCLAVRLSVREQKMWGSLLTVLGQIIPMTVTLDQLTGLVVEVSASRGADSGFDSCLRQDFSRPNHTGDLKIGTPAAILQGIWCYRVSAGTGWLGVSMLLLGELESLICNFCLSVAARRIVWADPCLRYTVMLLGR